MIIILQQVAVFSDSPLRPLIEKDLLLPKSWYVNCTPGATFLDVNVELEPAAAQWPYPQKPDYLVIAVGTNDAAKHIIVNRAERHFKALLLSAANNFPTSTVREEISYLSPCFTFFTHYFISNYYIRKLHVEGQQQMRNLYY